LILAQVAGGPFVNFVLLRPITTPPGFLENAAGSSLQLGVAVILLFVCGALSIGIAIAAWPVFRQYGSTMALWLLSLSVASFSMVAVENGTLMSMLSVSQAYAGANAADADTFEALGALIRSARKWAHITNLLVGGGMIFVLNSILYRFVLIPRTLAAFGLAAAALHISAVTTSFFGPYVLLLMIPLAVSYLALALWLMGKGFEERPHAFRPEGLGGAERSGT
jgi:hypothetical protein